MFFIQFWLQIKQNGYSKGPFRAPCSDPIYNKKLMKNCKKAHF